MKKTAILIAFAMLVLLLSGCASKESFRSLSQIQSSKSLRVLVRPGGSPYAYVENGEASGAEVELVREFAASIGVEAVFTPATPEEIALAIKDGTADLAIGKILLPSLSSYMLGYSLPAMREKIVVVCDRDAIYGSLSDLAGKKVGVTDSASVMPVAVQTAAEGTELIALESREDAARYKANGTVDVIMCLYGDAKQLTEQYGDELKCTELAGLQPLQYCAYMSKGNTGLMDAYNNFLTQRPREAASDEKAEE